MSMLALFSTCASPYGFARSNSQESLPEHISTSYSLNKSGTSQYSPDLVTSNQKKSIDYKFSNTTRNSFKIRSNKSKDSKRVKSNSDKTAHEMTSIESVEGASAVVTESRVPSIDTTLACQSTSSPSTPASPSRDRCFSYPVEVTSDCCPDFISDVKEATGLGAKPKKFRTYSHPNNEEVTSAKLQQSLDNMLRIQQKMQSDIECMSSSLDVISERSLRDAENERQIKVIENRNRYRMSWDMPAPPPPAAPPVEEGETPSPAVHERLQQSEDMRDIGRQLRLIADRLAAERFFGSEEEPQEPAESHLQETGRQLRLMADEFSQLCMRNRRFIDNVEGLISLSDQYVPRCVIGGVAIAVYSGVCWRLFKTFF